MQLIKENWAFSEEARLAIKKLVKTYNIDENVAALIVIDNMPEAIVFDFENQQVDNSGQK